MTEHEHVNLKEYILAILDEREKNLATTFDAQEKALELAANNAINEKLAQERQLFVQKESFETKIKYLEDKVEELEDRHKTTLMMMKLLGPLAGLVGATIAMVVEHLIK